MRTRKTNRTFRKNLSRARAKNESRSDPEPTVRRLHRCNLNQSRTTDRIKLDLDTLPGSSRFDSLTAFSIALRSSSENRIGTDRVEFLLRAVTIRYSDSKDDTV